MKPNYQDLNAQTSGVTASGAFAISANHSAHIMKILRDQLYSDKKMAVLREYSANAWDANREAGNGDKPIKVTLPTVMEPTLVIRDYGPGISHEDIFRIYAQYGESTKRGNDGQVGMLGIGSKSGFAYTDSFTVTTWQEGVQRIYTALLDTGAGSMNLLDACESDELTGTMIQIPVRPKDIPEFVEKATKLFIHFKPRPEINTNLPPEIVPEAVMQHGTIAKDHGDWYAVMGCIAYKIDMSQLRGLNAHRGGAGQFLDRLSGYLYFNIGDVEIAANREGLEYSDKTKERLIDKFIDLVDEFVKQTLDNLESGNFSHWEKRCRAQVLNSLHLPIAKLTTTLLDERFRLDGATTFTITFGTKQSPTTSIHIGETTRLIVRDEVRRIDGYGLSGFDYVIRPRRDVPPPLPTVEQVRAELDVLIDEAKMTGIPIVNISTIPWHQKAKFVVSPLRASNRKHTVKTFVLNTSDRDYSSPYSDHWDIETITPTDKDVFVLIRKFMVLDDPKDDDADASFYVQFRKDRKIMRVLKKTIPKIYGYKSTVKDPVNLAAIQGTQYSSWRTKFFDGLTTDPGVQPTYEMVRWLGTVSRIHEDYSYRETDKIDPKIVSLLFKGLGKDHQICAFLRKVMIAKREYKRTPGPIIKAVRAVCEIIDQARDPETNPTPQETMLRSLEEHYPMFSVVDDEGIKILLKRDTENLDKLIDYIRLVDRAKGLNNEQGTVTHANGRIDHHRLEGEAPCGEERSTELQQLEEGNRTSKEGRGLVEDRGPSIGREDCEELVERQVPIDRRLGDLLRSAVA